MRRPLDGHPLGDRFQGLLPRRRRNRLVSVRGWLILIAGGLLGLAGIYLAAVLK